MIDTLISDLGNVLLFFDNAIFFEALSRRTGRPAAEIRRVTHDNLDLVTLFEKGAISPKDFFDNASDLLGISLGFDEFFAAYCDIFRLNPPVLELYRRLRPRCRMALLSSTDVMRWTFIKRRFPEILFFDAYVLSFDYGAMKPDPIVYRAALAETGSGPGTAVFVDDLPENVEGALKQGIQGIVYTPDSDLRAALADFGVVAPPERSPRRVPKAR
jgi:putative hydrolase of the HAD superfamily